ncbi:MAG: helix-turn-helix domain-containing protein [Methyloprofundus sp.]|nr:helix-turn-helix domain-containing protein [Methyloprofundus sp.]
MEIQPPLDFLLQQDSVTEIKAPANTVICHSGDSCDNLIIIRTGSVRVSHIAADGRSITLYHIGENESCVLTASCIINHAAFPAIAETETAVTGYAIPAQKVQQWIQSEIQWQQYLFSLLSQRMASLIELVDSLAFQQLDKRLASWLLQQSKLDNTLTLKTTHQFIADELASSREVISRLLKDLEHKKFITLSRGYIQIHNLSGLNNYVKK